MFVVWLTWLVCLLIVLVVIYLVVGYLLGVCVCLCIIFTGFLLVRLAFCLAAL